ncbi:MAG: hypothetical protein ABI775_01945 [Pseudonocardiales bacterium]
MNARLMALVAATIAAVGCLSIGGPAAAVAPGAVTAKLSTECATYGFDVTNTTAVAHTVTLSLDGTAQAPVSVPAGATVHVPLATNTFPAVHVVLTDADGTVLGDFITRFCHQVVNLSVTIKGGTSYLLDGVGAFPVPPLPTHGHAVAIRGTGDVQYTPDPCFAGTDRFGFSDFIESRDGVVTVTVLPAPCRIPVRRTSTDCATVIYTASNPYALPVNLLASSSNGPSDLRHFTVPAHTTKEILRLTADPIHASTEHLSFTIVDPLITLLTDTVTFPCSTAAGSGPQLAATGSASGQRVGWAAGAIAGGALLTWLGRRRVRRSAAA